MTDGTHAESPTDPGEGAEAEAPSHLRFLAECQHLAAPFAPGDVGARAETFARFCGTPTFLIGQTAIVGGGIVVNATHLVTFDLYLFILLNLMFSLQAADAAPLIPLAQTRQAERDKAHAEADAKHREHVAEDSVRRQRLAEKSIDLLKRLMDENTELTKQVEALTQEIHGKVVAAA